ncbi:PREDICTED: protein tilB homolog [Thamnophis sirtalis]|uniref:Leucine-rich repeat-containing protein 6 n=1 Tax=Thamnophis sirtalis TaxID=35019 RepID=A0A6I9YLA2_9SAUR|nr:PREDICTED: protein tilB homolog [Thamnophis sirtalis]
MGRITEELVRQRAEHNNCELFSLEEVSLHQQDIEKIEHLDKWCRNLKILYLQNNLISKIENVSRLKKLEYLNLALNNIEKFENLEGCEDLQKLDLTANFIGELSSVKTLKNNIHLEELFLVGNPCTDFEGYRQFVVATLQQLRFLDGKEITRSERIQASQNYPELERKIHGQEQTYLLKREEEKKEAERRMQEKQKERKEKKKKGQHLGFDQPPRTDMKTPTKTKNKNFHNNDYNFFAFLIVSFEWRGDVAHLYVSVIGSFPSEALIDSMQYPKCQTAKDVVVTSQKASISEKTFDPRKLQRNLRRHEGLEKLEVDPTKYSFPDVTNIVHKRDRVGQGPFRLQQPKVTDAENLSFEDNPEVPPLI